MPTSNIREVVSHLERFVHGFDFTRPGKDQSLGRDVVNVVVRGPELGQVGGILGRCAEHKDPDGNEWAENSRREPPVPDGYYGFKERKYGIVDEPNRRTGQMLSEVTLKAKTKIEQMSIEIRPGTDEPPTKSYAPTGYLSKQDMAVTDTDKIRFAHTETDVKPARRFYAMTLEDARNVRNLCQENLNEYIVENSG